MVSNGEKLRRLIYDDLWTWKLIPATSGFIDPELKIIQIEMFQSKYFRSSTSLMQSNVFVLMSNIEKVLNQRRTHKKLHRLRCINGLFGSTGIIIRSIPQKPRTQTIRIDNHPNLVSVFLHRPVIMFPIRWWFVLFSCPCALRFAVLRWQSASGNPHHSRLRGKQNCIMKDHHRWSPSFNSPEFIKQLKNNYFNFWSRNNSTWTAGCSSIIVVSWCHAPSKTFDCYLMMRGESDGTLNISLLIPDFSQASEA